MNSTDAQLADARRDVEQLFVGACRALARSRDWNPFDLRCSFEDLWTLSRRQDCCYDRPSIGLNYAMWYHPRRTQDAMRLLLPTLNEHGAATSMLDLGCGTGATPWALAIASAHGVDVTTARVVAVDGSPPMLAAGQVMWDWLCEESSIADSARRIDVEWVCRSWTQPGIRLDEPDIVAGYLFDDSDGDRTAEVAGALHRLALHHRARFVHLLSSESKKKILAEAVVALTGSEHWAQSELVGAHRNRWWDGPVRGLAELRREVLAPASIEPRRLGRPPTFDDAGISVTLGRQASADTLDLAPEHPLILDDLQDEAATPEPRMTVIVGSAGSGKSRVLVERVARVIDNDPRGQVQILVTTFNKLLVFQLAKWLEDRLAAGGHVFERSGGDGDVWFRDPRVPTQRFIRLLNWDKVPTRLFGAEALSGGIPDDGRWRRRVAEVEAALPSAPATAAKELMTPRFLEAEMHRVIWGLETRTKQAYLEVDRVGRGSALGVRQRELVWETLMGEDHPETFSHVRLRIDRPRRPSDVHTHVFVDECQDFTPADFHLTARLVRSTLYLVAAGDETQSLHLGASYRRPGRLRSPGEPQMRVWKRYDLQGTYRLPLRICEAVQPIASHLRDEHRLDRSPDDEGDLVDLDAVTGATLGTRPIVVTGSEEPVVEQLRQIVEEYRPIIDAAASGNRRVTFAEGGGALCKLFRPDAPAGVVVEVRSMSKIKGLERPMVVWPIGADPPAERSFGEWIFTVLTRTTGLLVIVLEDDAPQEAVELLRLLRRDRLLFWDRAAETRFAEFVETGDHQG